MKRIIRGLLAAIVAVVLLGLGVAWARPGWLPTWARESIDRLISMVDAEPSASEQPKATDDDDEKKPPEGAGVGDERVVRLASSRLVKRLGIETTEVVKERHARDLSGNAEAAFDGQHMAEVVSRVSGVLREVKVNLGQVVRKGDVLAILETAQVGSAKVQYLTSREAAALSQATYDRTLRLTQEKAAPAKSELENRTALQQAKANLMDAEQKLHNFGFSDESIEQIAKLSDTSNRLEILAPIEGSITLWDATPGEAVEPITHLFTIVDARTMWLWIDVYEADVASVAVGQPVTFTISGTKQPEFSGKVTSVGMEVNPITRTTRVRADLTNAGGRLRANQFGRARVRVEPEHEALVVPATAIQDDGKVQQVFLPLPDGASFRPQLVVTTPTDSSDRVEVVSGLRSGQRVVTIGSFLLLSELHKDTIAGDVD